MEPMKIIVGILCVLVAGSFFLGRASKECLGFNCPEEKECFNPDNCPEIVECEECVCEETECEECVDEVCPEINCPECEDCSLLVDQIENKEICWEKQWYDGRRISVQIPC